MVPTPAKSRFARLIVSVFTLVILLLAASEPAASGARRTGSAPDCQPGADPRAVCLPATDSAPMGVTTMGWPAPGSKNASAPPARDPGGITRSAMAGAGPKSASAFAEVAPALTGADRRFSACGQVSDGSWTTTSAAFVVIRSCTLALPEDGFVYIAGTSSVGLSPDKTPFEARFALSVDDPAAGDPATDRWVNIYADTGDGTDKSVATAMLTSVISGTHTFNFLAARSAGTGAVQLYDPSLSVLFFPSWSAEVLSCGAASNADWTTTQATLQEIRSCPLDLPQPGFVYLNGSAAVGLASGGAAYEGYFRVGVDSVGGTASSDRWVNVYTDSGDGTDEVVETSLITDVTSGPHTFYFSGARWGGAGPVQLRDPSLNVLYFPLSSATAKICSAATVPYRWENSTENYSVIRSCTLDMLQSSFAFVDASASAGLSAIGPGNEWEGQFSLGLDDTNGSSLFDRWINIYNDAPPGDGTDRTVAVSGIVPLPKGAHTFYFVGRRHPETGTTGTVRVYASSLSVIVPGVVTFVPLVGR